MPADHVLSMPHNEMTYRLLTAGFDVSQTSRDACFFRVNACISNHRTEPHGSQSLVTLVTKVYSMDFGKVHSIYFGMNGVKAVSSRPMAVCRRRDCICIYTYSHISKHRQR